MIQCKDCPFYHQGPAGESAFSCDPFSTIVESECLQKWQLIKINQMVGNYQATLEYYRKLAPMQEKMFRVMEREIDDMNESDKWKTADDADEPDETGGSDELDDDSDGPQPHRPSQDKPW